MRRLFLLLPLLLAGCGIVAPPRDNAQWQSTLYDTSITWRATAPGAMLSDRAYIGFALALPTGQSCVVDIDLALARYELARVAAHEAGHCFQARHLLAGIPRPDLGDYYSGGIEGFAQTYALAYLKACGDSLKPLGWKDFAVPTCAEAPDPRTVKAEAR